MPDNCPDPLTHQYLETLDQMADEKQEACIHCGTVWYTIHHKDGVCHRCQRQGKPGRTVIGRRTVAGLRAVIISSLLLAALLAYMFM